MVDIPLLGGAKKRYAMIGTGGRAIFFYTAIARDYKSTSETVALADTNQTRMNFANSKLEALGHGRVPTFLAADFDKMIQDTKPDEVIVTTIDRTHNIYVGVYSQE
jgi:predicted dehydrogenase